MDRQLETEKGLTLVSWENEKFEFSPDLIHKSEFIRNLPDVSQEIKLDMLSIDSFTLAKIRDFLQIKPEAIDAPKVIKQETELFKPTSAYKEFFNHMNEEELLLLILAANKLDLRDLQTVCSMVFAKMFAEISDVDLHSQQSIEEMTVDQDDYLRFVNFKWPY